MPTGLPIKRKTTELNPEKEEGVAFAYAEDLGAAEKLYKNRILRVTDFSTHYDQVIKPYIYSQLAIPPLADTPHEIWLCPPGHRVKYERHGDLELAHSTDLALIRLVVSEDNIDHGSRTSLEAASYLAYKQLYQFIQKHQLGYVIRIWNYIPNILEEQGPTGDDRERYRQFNLGRYDAWLENGPKDESGEFLRPAATGVGTHNGPLILECLVAKKPASYIENPRQTSPYHYPKKYGSRAPEFSRGALRSYQNSRELYVSGTASIVGSETVHIGDPVNQVKEAIRNIETLIAKENLKNYGHLDGFTLQDLTGIRVYIKDPADYPVIRKQVEKLLGAQRPIAYLNNDICRPNLLLELEAIAIKSV